MRIGIFGGCFNPPHKKHEQIAVDLVKHNYLDKVIYVPAGNLYNKNGLIKDIDRYNMLKLITEYYDFLEVSDYEFDKLTYTYQTLTYFREKYPKDEIYFICGSDNLKEFDTWKEYEYVLETFKIIIIQRNNDNFDDIVKKYPKYLNNIILSDVKIDKLSSTEIRDEIKNNKITNLKNKLKKEVLEYIISNNLYK